MGDGRLAARGQFQNETRRRLSPAPVEEFFATQATRSSWRTGPGRSRWACSTGPRPASTGPLDGPPPPLAKSADATDEGPVPAPRTSWFVSLQTLVAYCVFGYGAARVGREPRCRRCFLLLLEPAHLARAFYVNAGWSRPGMCPTPI